LVNLFELGGVIKQHTSMKLAYFCYKFRNGFVFILKEGFIHITWPFGKQRVKHS
jgi:hypothetical protein